MRRLFLVLFALSLSTAGWSEDAALEACRSIEEPLERVVCYDRALDPAAWESATPESAAPDSSIPHEAIAVGATAAMAAERPDSVNTGAEAVFGQTESSIKDTLDIEQIKEIVQPVTAVQRGALGKLIVTLENGQIWKQVDSKKLNLKTGEAVSVRAGMGGSYYLSKTSGSRSVKVQRVD